MSKICAGVDLGGTSMMAVIANRKGKVLGKSGCATNPGAAPEATIELIGDQIRRACRKAGIKPSKLTAIGVGAPGAIDGDVVVRAPNLGWNDVPLGTILRKRFGVPVALGNDVQVAILGEHQFGAAKKAKRAVGIWVGTGIGGGLIDDGKLETGARGAAGEIGHMAIAEYGPLCSCGRKGCAEAFASRTSMERDVRAAAADGRETAVLRIMEERNKDRTTSSVSERALAADDAVMKEVLARAQHVLGLLTGNIVNFYDPEVVVIGGGIAERLEETFVAPIREVARGRFLRPDPNNEVRITHAKLGDYSGALGASAMARKKS